MTVSFSSEVLPCSWPSFLCLLFIVLLRINRGHWNHRELEPNLPVKDAKTRAIVDQIVDIQVGWMEEFAKEYPKLAGDARDITKENDSLYNTSYETYLRGELLTYSDELIKMYGKFIVGLFHEGKNLAKMTIENTVHMEGFKSLDEAEQNK